MYCPVTPHSIGDWVPSATRKVLRFVKESGRAVLEELEGAILQNMVQKAAGARPYLGASDLFIPQLLVSWDQHAVPWHAETTQHPKTPMRAVLTHACGAS